MNNKIINIQILRAVAAILVVIYHSSSMLKVNNDVLINIFQLGKVGVDVFFVISGYIILMSMDRKKYEPFCFLLKRLLRIYPIYWFFLLIYILMMSVNDNLSLTWILSSTLLIPIETFSPIISQAWTLQFEVYFYLIASIALLNKKVNNELLILFLLSLMYLIFSTNQNVIFTVLGSSLIFEFVFGMFAYRIRNSINISLVLLMVFISFIIFLKFNYNEYDNSSLRFFYSGFFSFSVLLLFEYFNRFFIVDNVIVKLLCKIGDSSYSLYLSHGLVIYVSVYIVNYIGIYEHSAFWLLPISIMSVFIGWIFYKYIEKPILSITNRYVK
ncbi:TPA: acyltransferase family protein [Photobacterium damselae]